MARCCRQYTVLLRSPTGEEVADLTDDLLKLYLVKKVNDVGTLAIELGNCDLPCDAILEGSRIEVWANCGSATSAGSPSASSGTATGSPDGSTNVLVGRSPFMVDYVNRKRSGFDERRIQILATDGNGWLTQRMVANFKESLQATALAEPADDLIKRIAREAWGPGANAYGGGSPLREAWHWVSVEANESLGPALSMTYQHQDLLSVFQDIISASWQQGVPLFFNVEQINDYGGAPFLELKTYLGQIGQDRTQGAGAEDAVVLSPENETLSDLQEICDWRDRYNRVYAGYGISDDGADFFIADDPNLATYLTTNPLGLRETFQNTGKLEDPGSMLPTQSELTLNGLRPTCQLDARVGETDGFCFICDWHWGDKITAAGECMVLDTWVDTLEIVLVDGRETVDARLASGLRPSVVGIENVLQRLRRFERVVSRLGNVTA